MAFFTLPFSYPLLRPRSLLLHLHHCRSQHCHHRHQQQLVTSPPWHRWLVWHQSRADPPRPLPQLLHHYIPALVLFLRHGLCLLLHHLRLHIISPAHLLLCGPQVPLLHYQLPPPSLLPNTLILAPSPPLLVPRLLLLLPQTCGQCPSLPTAHELLVSSPTHQPTSAAIPSPSRSLSPRLPPPQLPGVPSTLRTPPCATPELRQRW